MTCGAGTASGVAGAMSTPQGIAVDQATGNLYVTDQGNRRVDVFNAEGVFQGAFGWGVVVGEFSPNFSFGFCTPTTGCQAGQAGGNAGQLATNISYPAVAPAGAPNAGDLLVADNGNARVDQFKPQLNAGGEVTGVTFVKAFGWGVNSGAPELQVCTTTTGCLAGLTGAGAGQFAPTSNNSGVIDVAVDTTGAVYALAAGTSACVPTQPCRVQKFSESGLSVAEFAEDELTLAINSNEKVARIAIDPSDDHVFVVRGTGAASRFSFSVFEFDASGRLLSTSPPRGDFTTAAASGPRGFGIGTEGRLYVATTNTQVLILAPAPAPTAVIAAATAVTTSSAVLHGMVTPPAPGPNGGYATTYHFEYSSDGAHWTRAPTTEIAVGDGTGTGDPDSCPTDNPPTCNVTQVVTGLSASTVYQARVVATTGTATVSSPVTFTTSAAPPTVIQTYAADVDQTSATLSADINPQHLATTYHFEWGTTDAYGHRAPGFDRAIGLGTTALTAAEEVTGLQPNITYHFRVIAENDQGTTTGPDQQFTTLSADNLPDRRRFELVSPADKGPVGFVGALLGYGQQFQVTPEGDTVLYPMAFGLPGATAGGDLHYLATLQSSGWASRQADPSMSNTDVESGGGYNYSSRYTWFSGDASCRITASRQRLAPDAPSNIIDAGGGNLFRQNDDGSYTTITNVAPSNPRSAASQQAYGYLVLGASDDCRHVVFQTLPLGGGFLGYAYPGVGSSTVYEWDDGTLHDVAVRPDGSIPTDAAVGYQNNGSGSTVNAVSADGRRVVFTATSNAGTDSGKSAVYVRKGNQTTVDVSASKTAVAPNGARYQIASRDGSHVYFLANYGLTSAPSNGPTNGNCFNDAPQPCDLYVYNVETDELTDLSATASSANPQGAQAAGVLALSDDGQAVYFAAQGQLTDDAPSYAENAQAKTYSVYLRRDGTLAYVGQLAQADVGTSSTPQASSALLNRATPDANTRWTSQVTPDGRFLLFVSAANVTGYDSGGVQEAYLYSAQSGETVCVSCRRDGAPSVGSPATANRPTFPLPTQAFAGNARRIVSLSSDGSRVFFTMPDTLAPGAIEGNDNVYEWAHGQISTIVTGKAGKTGTSLAFVGASQSGDAAFFTTTDRLVPADTDSVADLYVARVDGGFAPPSAPASPCDPLADDACQGPLVSPPALASLRSATFSGVGNVPAPTATPPTPRPARLKVTKPKTVHGTSTRITVKVPAKGKLRVSGSGLKLTSRTAKRAGGTYHMSIRLSQHGRRTLTRKHRVRVRATVRLTPQHGRMQRVRVHLTFKRKTTRKRRHAKAGKRAMSTIRRTTVSAVSPGKVR